MKRSISARCIFIINRLLALHSIGSQEPSNTISGRKTKLQDKLRCWSCGMYQTETELCLSCDRCNSWTLNQLSKEFNGNSIGISTNRIKPEYEKT